MSHRRYRRRVPLYKQEMPLRPERYPRTCATTKLVAFRTRLDANLEIAKNGVPNVAAFQCKQCRGFHIGRAA